MTKELLNLTTELNLFSIGSNLKDIREHKNISQRELADITGISVRTIRYYETLDAMPSVINAYKLAICLDVSLEELFMPSSSVPLT